MLHEIRFFKNDAGVATIYAAGHGGYVVERQINRESGECIRRLVNCKSLSAAVKQFDKMRVVLRVIQAASHKHK